jgi:hypothetical protein
MSDITITDESGTLYSNDYTVPSGSSSVSFSTNKNCVVCFENSETFGLPSITLDAGTPSNLPIIHRQSTNFEPIFPGNPCSLALGSSPGVHVIIIS